MDKIESCPFCGCDEIYAGRISAIEYAAFCMKCKSSTPKFSLPDRNPERLTMEQLEDNLIQQAINHWNKRV